MVDFVDDTWLGDMLVCAVLQFLLSLCILSHQTHLVCHIKKNQT